MGESSSKHSAGAAALDLMGRVDDLDRLLDGAKAASAEFPEGRIFEDRDNSNKVGDFGAESPCTIINILFLLFSS